MQENVASEACEMQPDFLMLLISEYLVHTYVLSLKYVDCSSKQMCQSDMEWGSCMVWLSDDKGCGFIIQMFWVTSSTATQACLQVTTGKALQSLSLVLVYHMYMNAWII